MLGVPLALARQTNTRGEGEEEREHVYRTGRVPIHVVKSLLPLTWAKSFKRHKGADAGVPPMCLPAFREATLRE